MPLAAARNESGCGAGVLDNIFSDAELRYIDKNLPSPALFMSRLGLSYDNKEHCDVSKAICRG